MSFATPDDLIARKDVRIVGDLAGDQGRRLSESEILSNESVQAALDSAAGEILAALLQGERYSRDDLDDLSDESRAHLIKINCDVAFWQLWQRRPSYDDDPGRDAARKDAREHLEMLRTGKHVFDVAGAKEAGQPAIVGASRVQIEQQNLIVDQARGRYYPYRRTPHNR